jgi:hypothetical protein
MELLTCFFYQQSISLSKYTLRDFENHPQHQKSKRLRHITPSKEISQLMILSIIRLEENPKFGEKDIT